MTGLPLAFSAPPVLLALIALPAIWLLLRITPPSPQRIAFPPLRIFADLIARRSTPARTPWWLLLIRLLTCGLLILACAGPLWNPPQPIQGNGPLIFLVDNGFPAAPDWQQRSGYLLDKAEQALRTNRAVAVVPLATAPSAIEIADPGTALSALRNLKPAPYLADRSSHLEAIRSFLGSHPGASVVWISDGIAGSDGTGFTGRLAEMAGSHSVTVIRRERPDVLALAPTGDAGGGISGEVAAHVLRPHPNGRDHGIARLVDSKGQPLAEAPFRFDGATTQARVVFDIPTELRNTASRIEVAGERSAGAVLLIGEGSKRRTIGLVAGTAFDQSQPLLSPTYYIERALQPFAEIYQEKGSSPEAVARLLDRHVNVLVLADIGTLDEAAAEKILNYVEGGGLLIRFAGTRLVAGNDQLLPVRLRQGDRSLGSALSWSQPKKLAPFQPESPFHGLATPDEITVKRQVLAEPDALLPERTWASLEDGTPLVTAERRGKGTIVLFHVTATPAWSSLPLSGLFVDLLRRTIRFGQLSAARPDTPAGQPLAPRLVLDGYGDFSLPAATDRSVTADFTGRAAASVPPGFYGAVDAGIAVNALVAGDTLRPDEDSVFAGTTQDFAKATTVDLRMPLLVAALLLLLLDSLAVLRLNGGLARHIRKPGPAATLIFAFCLVVFTSGGSCAQSPVSGEVEQAALATRLAYVVTGDGALDDISKAGLSGLGQFLYINTSFEPAPPAGVNLEKDELSFYPLIYWPISASQASPSDQALRNLDAFMKNGGTVLFDTRDALMARPGMPATPEAAFLNRLLARLDVPQLERLPADHVLTKTFYLLASFPGRYDTSPLWVEVSTPRLDGDDSGPVNAGDGVSPVIVTGNDFAAAWAIGPRNETLFPVTGSDPRQREMAFRAGVNIVLYTLTGNYKADQVHVEDLLERLGRQGDK